MAHFVPIGQAMFSKGTTWPPRTSAGTRVTSGSMAPTLGDRLENGRPPSESAAVAHGDGRPTESQWDAVIDRATD